MAGGNTAGQVQTSPQMQASADLASSRMQDFNSRFKPLQNYYMDRVQGDVGTNTMRAQGSAEAGARASIGGAGMAKVMDSDAASGAGVGSGKQLMGINSVDNATSSAASGGATAGQQAVQSQYLAGMGHIASMGESEANNAENNMEQSAQNGQTEEMGATGANATLSGQRDANTAGALSTGLSAGAGYLMQGGGGGGGTTAWGSTPGGGEGVTGSTVGWNSAQDSVLADQQMAQATTAGIGAIPGVQ